MKSFESVLCHRDQKNGRQDKERHREGGCYNGPLQHPFLSSASKRDQLSCSMQQRDNTIFMWALRFSRRWLWRMLSSGMLRRVALVRTDVSEELSASFIRVTRVGELETTLAVTSNWRSYKSHTA
jgi:hypothetical protein